MIIAISQRADLNKNNQWIDNLEQNYVKYLEKFGILCLLIPNVSSKIGQYFNLLIDGVIITGGNDINPLFYGDKVKDWPGASDERDRTEKSLLEIATEKGLPVLGICRGMQFINVYFGGKLVRNIQENIGPHKPGLDHEIKITDKKVKDFLGKEKYIVNSFHNQAVTAATKSKNLNSFAEAKQGIIEGIYHPSMPIAGIEWHPERNSPDISINERIIKAFLKRELFWKRK